MQAAIRVLAVDDERLMRMTLHHILSEQGYVVDLAPSGRKAMDLLDRFHYDLLLTDLRLDDMSGIDLVRYARTVNPGAGVIVLTASIDDDDNDRVLAAGAAAVLVKPCRLADLARQAREVLGPRAPQGPQPRPE